MAPAERADVIVDFTNVPMNTEIIMLNLGPDEPFGGGVPGVDFDSSDPDTTDQVMKFKAVVPLARRDTSMNPTQLTLPAFRPLGPASNTRQVSLNEEESKTVRVTSDENGIVVLTCDDPNAEPFGPTAALLGTLNSTGAPVPLGWDDPITENPALNAIEVWEMYNFTEDAHPIHIHEVQFQVVDRQPIRGGAARLPESWKSGFKDTVIAYPGEITRVRALFDLPGLYVWHCHIVEHEDNEMMRPYRIGPIPPDALG
jgi:spore coat protein A